MRIPLPSSTTYGSRFGSWKAAVELAGLKPNIPTPHFKSLVKRDKKDKKKKAIKIKNFNERQPSPKLRFQILKRDRFSCTYCGGKPRDGFVLVVDHIIPFSKGGLTTTENLTTACWTCNIGKSNNLL